MAFFCLVLVALEASVLVRHFTRFTEEGFCALISLIFIYDAIGKMLSLMEAYPIYRPGISGDTGVVPYGCLCYFPDTKGGQKGGGLEGKLSDALSEGIIGVIAPSMGERHNTQRELSLR